MKVILAQVYDNWCLPSSSGVIENAGLEQSLLAILFLLIGVGFSLKLDNVNPFSQVSSKRRNLLSNKYLYGLVNSNYFSFSIRLLSGLIFVFVLITGFYGRKYTSLAAGFTWLFWWTLLIYFVAFAGKVFCAVCPWDFFANLIQFGWFHKLKNKTSGLNLKWPKALKNVYPAIIFFILLTWLELGFDITRNSYFTAVMGLMMVLMAVLTALIFERRSFCRYACLVGRVSGLYAQVSPVELRKVDDDVCKSCKTKECVTGTDTTTACPTFEKPFLLKQNTYCTLCTECIRSCEKDNLSLFTRPIGVDLESVKTSRKDESVLAYVMLILTFFHGISMTKYWFDWTAGISVNLGVNYQFSFTILMLVMMIGCYLVFRGFELFIGRFVSGGNLGVNLAYAFIPITLGYHLGHNSMHLFIELSYMVPILNDPFGFGWDLFGLAAYQPQPFISPDILRYIQLSVVLVGFFYSVKTLRQRVDQISKLRNDRRLMFIGYYIMILVLAVLAIWFVYQPMVMKSVGV
ncbi:MAG: 4Fe-4S binding protein [Reichenbachiella sp.]